MNTYVARTAQRHVRSTSDAGIVCTEIDSSLDQAAVRELAESRFLPAAMTQRLFCGTPREFDVSCAVGVKCAIRVITCNGYAPSSTLLGASTVAVASLCDLFGPCPHAGGVKIVLLDGGPRTEFRGGDDHPAEALAVEHVNSGFSYEAGGCGYVVVFRCAEAHRTVVHELLHAWRVHTRDDSKAQSMAERHLGAPPACLLSESFVEALTWLLLRGFGPSTTDDEELAHSSDLVRSYFACACDGGQTSAWCYIVGKHLLISDRGASLCAFLTRGDTSGAALPHSRSRTLSGRSSYVEVVKIMCSHAGRIGKHKEAASAPLNRMPRIRMVANDWGPAFAKTTNTTDDHASPSGGDACAVPVGQRDLE